MMRCASPRRRATSRGGWAARRRVCTWAHRRPWLPRPSPASSPIRAISRRKGNGADAMANTFTGKVWKFEDDINTDLVIPGFAVMWTLEEQLPHCFSANRPGWVDEVQPGDVLIAGRNFGVGSARPIGDVLRDNGISGVVADSFNGL